MGDQIQLGGRKINFKLTISFLLPAALGSMWLIGIHRSGVVRVPNILDFFEDVPLSASHSTGQGFGHGSKP